MNHLKIKPKRHAFKAYKLPKLKVKTAHYGESVLMREGLYPYEK